MTDDLRPGGDAWPHLVIPNDPIAEPFRRRGSGGGSGHLYPITDRIGHAATLRSELEGAVALAARAGAQWDEQLRSNGIVLAVDGWLDGFELALDSLDLRSKGIELLSVIPASVGSAERATVLVPYERVTEFFKRLDQYSGEQTKGGRPKNENLVANIRAMGIAAIPQLWTEPVPFPDGNEPAWWELWLRRTGDELQVLETIAQRFQWRVAPRPVAFPGRTITAVRARASELGLALSSRLPIAELRSPKLIQSPLELPLATQRLWVADLVNRIRPASANAPAVCLLDTGIYRHTLFGGSLDPTDILHVVGPDGADRNGHGTELGGLALFGDLANPLTSGQVVSLSHRLESVKVLPDPGEPPNSPDTYAAVTAAGTAAPEIGSPDTRRVFCIANSDHDYRGDGRPSSWSATIDALAFGTDVVAHDGGLELLTDPDPSASRLLVIAAGNVREGHRGDYLDLCDTSPVEDPGQAWNALTVGACTDLRDVPAGPDFVGWRPLAAVGDLSPFSRTSLLYGPLWPKKPDIVLEGGNLLASPRGTVFDTPDTVCLTTTSHREPSGQPLAASNATSAAAAQAARLAAMASARYPSLWPESLRGLLVHSAEWTDPMREAIRAAPSRTQRRQLIRRYGFGVPTQASVLRSTEGAVTLIAQATIRPFVSAGSETRLREMNLHDLPWPRNELLALGNVPVRLRVTLSYFIEPNPSSRGWKGRYAYASHGLRFDVRRPGEPIGDFRRRLNKMAEAEEGGAPVEAGQEIKWFVGTTARNLGSLHADMWKGTAAELADCGVVAVFPVGGWWKLNNQQRRTEIPVRYCLLVSLLTPAVGVDLYTPIAAKIGIPVPIEIQTDRG